MLRVRTVHVQRMIHPAGNATSSRGTARVCIITHGAIGSNPRVVKEADALQAAGYGVRVISTRTLQCVEPRDDALLKGVAWSSERIDLRSMFAWGFRRGPQMLLRKLYLA